MARSIISQNEKDDAKRRHINSSFAFQNKEYENRRGDTTSPDKYHVITPTVVFYAQEPESIPILYIIQGVKWPAICL